MSAELSENRELTEQAPAQPLFFPFLAEDELETYKLHRRFDRMGRLVGDPAMKKLMNAHAMVIGLGGVGSFAAEMLVRSGIGKVTIVDFDEVCITNVNRQLHAMQGVIGKHKAEVLAERFRKINPKAEIQALIKFYNRDSSDEILGLNPEYVVDAIDSVTSKAHLLATCLSRGIRVVCCAGAGGRMDPTQIRISDLKATHMDPLAKMIRKILRGKFGVSGKPNFGIPTVYSPEPVTAPIELAYDEGKGFRCVCPQGQNEYFTCDNRNLILGTAGFVTGAFGFAAASVVVRDITKAEFWPVPVEHERPVAEIGMPISPL